MNKTLSTTIVINIYRDGARWFAARWIDGEYDGCDELDILDGAPEEVALDEAREMPLLVLGERRVNRVADRDAAWSREEGTSVATNCSN